MCILLGNFVVKVPKKTKGEHFKNLDMITELLRPQKRPTAEHLVEEIDDTDADDGGIIIFQMFSCF